MTQKAKLFGGDNLRNEFERLEAGLDPQQNSKTNGPESETYKKRRLDMCDRIFESVVLDLKILVISFESENINQDTLVKELEKILYNLKMFASKGEVRCLIARATTVILDSVTKDLNNENNSIDIDSPENDVTSFC